VLFYAGQRANNLNLSEKILTPIGKETTLEQIKGLQMDAGINAISRWARSGSVDIKEHSNAISDFTTRVKGGEKPLEALNIILRNANIKLHPEMITYPKEGQELIDTYGQRGIAYPDGTIKYAPAPKLKMPQKAETKGALKFEEL